MYVRACIEKNCILCFYKLARCDCFKHTQQNHHGYALFQTESNPCGQFGKNLFSCLFVFLYYFSYINDYELMALFTIPLLLEFSIVVIQNTTHVFAMRSKPHNLRLCLHLFECVYALRMYMCGLCARRIYFFSFNAKMSIFN